MSITRPPFVGPNKPVNPNDADAVEAEKQRDLIRDDLVILISAIKKSQSEYDEDIDTFKSALPQIDDQSPIVAEAVDRLMVTLSDTTCDDNYNEVTNSARMIYNKI